MANNRLAKILKGMAARKELKTAHYKIYLCLLAAAQDGSGYNMNVLSIETGLNIRTVQRAVKEMLDSGNVSQNKDGWLQLAFDPGIGRDRFVASDSGSARNSDSSSQSLSMSNLRSYIIKYVSRDQISDFRDKKSDTHDVCLRISDLPSEGDRMGPDNRFKEVVDGLFEVYEKEVGKKLNPIFGGDDAAMIKRLLKNLPEESVSRLVESFKIFLTSPDKFHATQIGTKPVRYWATRINEFLPEKEVDFKKAYDKMLEKEV